MAGKDRRTTVLESLSFNGIDFVEVVDPAQQTLRVHFLNAVGGAAGGHYSVPGLVVPLAETLDMPAITITGGESIPTVSVAPITLADWSMDDTHLMLTITTTSAGDFSNYTLAVRQKAGLSASNPLIDPYFSTCVFTFKALCPSDLDCAAPPAVCPAPSSGAPPIDYLAKDFLSFRQALLDFSAVRYPEWQERSEADFGVMFLEALCAVADDLSYTQDRIAAEAALKFATQRRSVVRLARLVDYEPSPALSASVLLQFDVKDGVKTITDGLVVTAAGPDGTPIPFETGPSLAGRLATPATPTAPVNSAWNRGVMRPYWFDDSQQCLPAGATQMYVLGTGYPFQPGQLLLIETQPPTGAPISQIVRLLDAVPSSDPLYPAPSAADLGAPPLPPGLTVVGPGSPPRGTALTLFTWNSEDALTDDRDLACTTLAGNLVAATQGQTQTAENFYIPPTAPVPPKPLGIPAIVRTGPNDTSSAPSLQYLYTLGAAPLAWLQPSDPTEAPQPEVVITGQAPESAQQVSWQFARWLLDAQPFDPAFTVDAASFARLPSGAGNQLRFDYDGDAGDTLRFGDSVFGQMPLPGTAFTVTYRVGLGSAGNVAAGAITALDPAHAAGVVRLTNPMAAAGGADAQTLDSVRNLAPQAFHAVQYRAVTPTDYQAAAQTLPWVKRAGATFRWTGSWLTAFTTPEPVLTESVASDQRTQLIDLLNRYRMAGYESYVADPIYVSLDLKVQVCAQATAFRGDVEQAVRTALSTAPGGVFAHGNFTFGQPLEASELKAAIQNVPGAAGVLGLCYRIRGLTATFTKMTDTVPVGANQIIRCDNDPSLPEQGTLQLIIEGGK